MPIFPSNGIERQRHQRIHFYITNILPLCNLLFLLVFAPFFILLLLLLFSFNSKITFRPLLSLGCDPIRLFSSRHRYCFNDERERGEKKTVLLSKYFHTIKFARIRFGLERLWPPNGWNVCCIIEFIIKSFHQKIVTYFFLVSKRFFYLFPPFIRERLWTIWVAANEDVAA